MKLFDICFIRFRGLKKIGKITGQWAITGHVWVKSRCPVIPPPHCTSYYLKWLLIIAGFRKFFTYLHMLNAIKSWKEICFFVPFFDKNISHSVSSVYIRSSWKRCSLTVSASNCSWSVHVESENDYENLKFLISLITWMIHSLFRASFWH